MAEKTKTYTANISKTAKTDLKEIVKFISKNNPMNALKILKKIEDRIITLNHFPERGGYVPELLKNNIKDYRQLIESPWKIIYRIGNDVVNILLIIDSRRNTQDLLLEKLIK